MSLEENIGTNLIFPMNLNLTNYITRCNEQFIIRLVELHDI
jgi:hypothetical protein